MADTTPPDLPPYHSPSEFGPCDHVVSLKEAIAYAEACRADERRKARAELIAEMTPVASVFKCEDRIRFNPRLALPRTDGYVELAIIPKE